MGARANSLVRRKYAVAVIALCSGSTENCKRNKEVQHLPKLCRRRLRNLSWNWAWLLIKKKSKKDHEHRFYCRSTTDDANILHLFRRWCSNTGQDERLKSSSILLWVIDLNEMFDVIYNYADVSFVVVFLIFTMRCNPFIISALFLLSANALNARTPSSLVIPGTTK